MDILPQDIIFDIFARLPAKSIGRSRCVSKPWKTLLYHPQFIKTHLNRTKQNHPKQEESVIMVSNDKRSLYTTKFMVAHHMFDEITTVVTKLSFVDHLFSSTKIDGVASYDGLILIRDGEKMFSLINPTTKGIHRLPMIPVGHDHDGALPSYGIGYDPVSDDYKVVTIFCCKTINGNEPHERVVYVYSVKDGTWKQVQNSPYFHADIYGPSICFNGCIHWVASRPLDLSFVIAVFDLKEEKFHELARPRPVADTVHTYNHLKMFRGRFGVQFFRTRGVVHYWTMEEYGVQESWKELSIVDPDDKPLRPVCILGDKQVVLARYSTGPVLGMKLVVYNLEDRTFKDIVLHDMPRRFQVERTIMESLVSPHCTVETAGQC